MSASTVVVIGSGPSGAMAAHELVKLGVPVTMLESGSEPVSGVLVRLNGRNVWRRKPDENMREGDRHVAKGDPNTRWYYNLTPGGLSNNWTGAVPRFAPEDFYEGERLDERYRWPLDYKELVPYYEKAEWLMDVTGDPQDRPILPAGKYKYKHQLPKDWQRIGKYAAAHGQGLTTLPLADGAPWLLVRRGTAFNSFTQIVQPLLRAPNFKLITNAHALRLEWSGEKRKVTGVVYHDRTDGSQKRVEATAVIVTCGPLNSAKLLFDSACADFPEGLGNSQGVLGRYLHDHAKEWWSMDVDKGLSPLVPSGYLTRKPHAESSPLMACAWTIGVVTTKDKLRSFTPLKTNLLGVQVFGTMIPREEYCAQPSQEKKDEFGLPALDICIRFEDDVVQNMVWSRRHWLALLDEAGYKGNIHEVAPQLMPGESVHYGGPVRMHNSPKYGVLDRWNRLHDVPNVIVSDAAAFTTGSEKNPTLTAMALSARAAHKLADDLKSG